MARLHADGEVPTGKLSRVTVWAGCVFVLLLLCLKLPLAGHVVDVVYAGLVVSGGVAIATGRAWFESLVWNMVWRWRHR
jgi:hypothetical protein